jgi:hypothetical protein
LVRPTRIRYNSPLSTPDLKWMGRSPPRPPNQTRAAAKRKVGMATPMEHVEDRIPKPDPQGLQPADLLSMYRTMYLSRRIDDRELLMKRQQKIFFQISGAGHEAIGVAAGMALRPAYDWFFTYYRDRALALQLGVSPYEMFLEGVAAADDPASGGRQMPSHWGHKDYNLVSVSSPTGTQFLQAVGCAEAGIRAGRTGMAGAGVQFHDDEVVLVTTGDGTTSEGEFWESLNTASNLKLPVIYLVEDNGYAISVPVEVNTAGGSISKLVSGFPDLLVIEVDGTLPRPAGPGPRTCARHQAVQPLDVRRRADVQAGGRATEGRIPGPGRQHGGVPGERGDGHGGRAGGTARRGRRERRRGQRAGGRAAPARCGHRVRPRVLARGGRHQR